MRTVLFGFFIASLFHGIDLKAQQLRLTKTTFIGGTHTGGYVSDAIATNDKGIFWCGYTTDSGTGDIPFTGLFNSGYQNTLIGKLDSVGNKQWVKVLSTPFSTRATSACEMPGGGYALFDGSPTRSGDWRIIRVDAQGNFLWSKTYGSSGQEGYGNIISTPDKGLLLFGMSGGADGDVPFNYINPPATFQPWDWVVIKMDSLGNKQWVKVYGGTGDEVGGEAFTDGKFYYLASQSDSRNHDCIDTLDRPGFKGYSIYVLKIDTAGNLIWSNAYGAGSVTSAMFDDRDSTIVIGGNVHGNFYEFQGNHGNEDLFLMKIDRDGSFKWARQYGDENEDGKENTGLCKAPNGGYVLAGKTLFRVQTQYNHIGKSLEYDSWLFWLDRNGNIITQMIYGGSNYEASHALINLPKSIVAVGLTSSISFTEGTGQNYQPLPGGKQPANTYFSHFGLWPLGIEGLHNNQQRMRVFPNPASELITVELLESHKAGALSITSNTGQIVYYQEAKSGHNRFVISTATYMPGGYSIKWNEGGTSQTCRIIIVR